MVNQHKTLQNENSVNENHQKQTKEIITEEENKKHEKSAKHEKTQPTNSNNNSDEKTRRKQIEIELKKWEREQVLFFYCYGNLIYLKNYSKNFQTHKVIQTQFSLK